MVPLGLVRAFVASVLSAVMICAAQATEITIFGREGEASAYVDTTDTATIFLWMGRPVAYLSDGSLYGYNGKHLGWLDNGIVRDNEGYAVGFLSGAMTTLTKLEGLKGLKQLRPLKALKQLEPLRPLYSSYWSNTPLELFLLDGIDGG